MSKQTHGIPQKGNGGLVFGGMLLLVVTGGLVYFKTQASLSEPEALTPPPTIKAVEPPAPRLNHAPPPPPPAEEETAPEQDLKAPGTAQKRNPTVQDSCDGVCDGNVTPTLRSALSRRASGARSCYNTALRQNAALQGKMTVSLRVSPSGRTCSADASSSTLGDASVESCVVNQFRTGNFPPAQGGCVDVAVPILFTKEP